jgi:hypothetical protein
METQAQDPTEALEAATQAEIEELVEEIESLDHTLPADTPIATILRY